MMDQLSSILNCGFCSYRFTPNTPPSHGSGGDMLVTSRDGASWLDDSNVLMRWKRVAAPTVKEQVPGVAFVEASRAIISIFDLIPGMGMVKSDMMGNASTLASNLGSTGMSLQTLVNTELNGGDTKALVADKRSSTCALLWLSRALRFVQGFLQALLKNPNKPLKDCVMEGYEQTLRSHHNFAVRTTFGVAVNAAPERADFMARLGPDGQLVTRQLGDVLPVFGAVMNMLLAYLKDKGVER